MEAKVRFGIGAIFSIAAAKGMDEIDKSSGQRAFWCGNGGFLCRSIRIAGPPCWLTRLGWDLEKLWPGMIFSVLGFEITSWDFENPKQLRFWKMVYHYDSSGPGVWQELRSCFACKPDWMMYVTPHCPPNCLQATGNRTHLKGFLFGQWLDDQDMDMAYGMAQNHHLFSIVGWFTVKHLCFWHHLLEP